MKAFQTPPIPTSKASTYRRVVGPTCLKYAEENTGGVCALHLHGSYSRSVLTHCSLPIYNWGKQVKKRMACTSVPCSWFPPTFHSVLYAQQADTVFSTPQQKRKSDINSAIIILVVNALKLAKWIPWHNHRMFIHLTQISVRLENLCYSLLPEICGPIYLCVCEMSSVDRWQMC